MIYQEIYYFIKGLIPDFWDFVLRTDIYKLDDVFIISYGTGQIKIKSLQGEFSIMVYAQRKKKIIKLKQAEFDYYIYKNFTPNFSPADDPDFRIIFNEHCLSLLVKVLDKKRVFV